jgi:hypothetical protein
MVVFVYVSLMAKLTSIGLPDAASKKAKVKIPTVFVLGDVVTRFNEARDQVDKATEVMTELKPTLIEAGLQAVFEHNIKHADDSKAQISSVNLMDKPPEEDTEAKALADSLKQTCMFSWTRKDLKNDFNQVDAEFKRLRTVDGKRTNVNDYVVFMPVADFDSSVFMVDGKFSEERYTAFMNALNEVSAKFEVDNPLSCGQVLAPKPDFHDKRWKTFDVESNIAIQSVLPTQCNLKPVRPEAK